VGEHGPLRDGPVQTRDAHGLGRGLDVARDHLAGVPAADLAALERGDWDDTDGSLTIRSAKGGRGRIVWLPDWAADLVEAWVNRVPGGPLLRRVTRTGVVLDTGISGSAVGEILLRIGQEAGVDCRAHDLRRSLITHLLDDGVDPLAVASVSGHARIESLRRYDRRSITAGRHATQARSL
jgi:integrase